MGYINSINNSFKNVLYILVIIKYTKKGDKIMKSLKLLLVASLATLSLNAGGWVNGKVDTIQQWENNSYFWIKKSDNRYVKGSISTLLNADGAKKLLTLMITAQASSANVSVYIADAVIEDSADYNGKTHVMKSIKILP